MLPAVRAEQPKRLQVIERELRCDDFCLLAGIGDEQRVEGHGGCLVGGKLSTGQRPHHTREVGRARRVGGDTRNFRTARMDRIFEHVAHPASVRVVGMEYGKACDAELVDGVLRQGRRLVSRRDP